MWDFTVDPISIHEVTKIPTFDPFYDASEGYLATNS